MLSLLRGLALGTLLVGVGLIAAPNHLGAQAKKDEKKDPKEKNFSGKIKIDDTIRDKKLSFPTSDHLSIQGYWFPAQNTGDGKSADAVMMFPAPGNKINDNWIALGKTLSEQGFSVLLFDFRGCGMNGPDRSIRIFEDDKEFKREKFNLTYAPPNATKTGMDYKAFTTRYKDSVLFDLQGARFFLDKQNDDQKCNSNRIWMVSEGQGASLALGFIAAESYRFSLFKENNLAAIQDERKAVKDYAGLVALSYNGSNPTGTAVYNTAMVSKGSSADGREGMTHLEKRMAMVMVYGKKEGPGASKGLMNRFVTGTDEQMKLQFKYSKELDNSKAAKPPVGGDLLNEEDTFGARDYIIKAMIEIGKDKQDFGKARTTRNAGPITVVPRFNIETYKPN